METTLVPSLILLGWAPQQILAWSGLMRYGFQDEAERLAYKWLYMVTKAFVDFNGIVVEKYDVTRPIDPRKLPLSLHFPVRNYCGFMMH